MLFSWLVSFPGEARADPGLPLLSLLTPKGQSQNFNPQGAPQVALVVRNLPAQCMRHKRHGFDPRVRKIPWRRAWKPTPVFLPGESHGQRSLAGYSPWGRIESDMTEVT